MTAIRNEAGMRHPQGDTVWPMRIRCTRTNEENQGGCETKTVAFIRSFGSRWHADVKAISSTVQPNSTSVPPMGVSGCFPRSAQCSTSAACAAGRAAMHSSSQQSTARSSRGTEDWHTKFHISAESYWTEHSNAPLKGPPASDGRPPTESPVERRP